MNIGHCGHKKSHGRKGEALVAKVIGYCAPYGWREVMDNLVTRPLLRRALQEEDRKCSKNSYGDPIINSFQFRFPVSSKNG